MKYIFSFLLSLVVLTSCTQNQDTSSPSSDPKTPTATVSVDENVITMGSGVNVVQIFSDFQCPACIQQNKKVYPLFEKFAKEGRLKIEFRQFPLTSIHPNAYNDAVAFYCVANESDKWKDYANALYAMESKKAGKNVSNAERIDLAKTIGIESKTLTKCIEKGETKKYVDRDDKLADKLRVSGTPTYIFNGNRMDMSIFRDEKTFNEFFERVLGK